LPGCLGLRPRWAFRPTPDLKVRPSALRSGRACGSAIGSFCFLRASAPVDWNRLMSAKRRKEVLLRACALAALPRPDLQVRCGPSGPPRRRRDSPEDREVRGLVFLSPNIYMEVSRLLDE